MLNTTDYRLAPSGKGPQARQWKDKPHRLVYDLCREIESFQAAGATAADARELKGLFATLIKAHGLRTVVNALGKAVDRAGKRGEYVPYSAKDRAAVDPCDLETAAANLQSDLY